ncbi:MAG: heme-binding protein, partial [Fuerstiella sp.]|nr:heme-binding protein [Fuerstiella sp.]
GRLSQPSGALFNIEHSNGGLISLSGGIPLKSADGSIMGAIGVSGSTVENDHEVAALLRLVHKTQHNAKTTRKCWSPRLTKMQKLAS